MGRMSLLKVGFSGMAAKLEMAARATAAQSSGQTGRGRECFWEDAPRCMRKGLTVPPFGTSAIRAFWRIKPMFECESLPFGHLEGKTVQNANSLLLHGFDVSSEHDF